MLWLALRLFIPLLLSARVLAAASPTYHDDIAPLLANRCLVCHSGAQAPLGLRLDSLENLLRGSQRGPVVHAGDAAGSELLRRLTGSSQPRMPYDGPPYLTDAEIDLFNPNVIRNSRGALLIVNAVFCSNGEALDWLGQNKIKVYATSIAPNSIDYRQALKGGPLAYVFGSEAKGISEFWKESAQAITIPMKGTLDSLNLSVAVGIVLFNQ